MNGLLIQRKNVNRDGTNSSDLRLANIMMNEKEQAKEKLRKSNLRVALILATIAIAATMYSIAYLPAMLMDAGIGG